MGHVEHWQQPGGDWSGEAGSLAWGIVRRGEETCAQRQIVSHRPHGLAALVLQDARPLRIDPNGLRFLLANEQRQKASSLDMATDLVLNSMRLRVPEMETV